MKWVTRARPKTDRIACPWLIRRFIDPEAQILYVPKDDVLAVAEREGAVSFDAPGARYTHRDHKCSFEVLIDEHNLNDNAALTRGGFEHPLGQEAVGLANSTSLLDPVEVTGPLAGRDNDGSQADDHTSTSSASGTCRNRDHRSRS